MFTGGRVQGAGVKASDGLEWSGHTRHRSGLVGVTSRPSPDHETDSSLAQLCAAIRLSDAV